MQFSRIIMPIDQFRFVKAAKPLLILLFVLTKLATLDGSSGQICQRQDSLVEESAFTV
jgi:hypothetical protein